MRWRSNHDVPKSRLIPRLAKMAEKRARSEHTVRSHASDNPKPAPTATPSTRAMVGTGQPCTATTASPSTRMPASWLPIGPLLLPPDPALPLPLRSAPAQKSVPPPVSTMTRVPEYASRRKVSPMATHMSPVHAFFVSGRSMVTVVTSPSAVTLMSGWIENNSVEVTRTRTSVQ